jgi:hypothetical protein
MLTSAPHQYHTVLLSTAFGVVQCGVVLCRTVLYSTAATYPAPHRPLPQGSRLCLSQSAAPTSSCSASCRLRSELPFPIFGFLHHVPPPRTTIRTRPTPLSHTHDTHTSCTSHSTPTHLRLCPPPPQQSGFCFSSLCSKLFGNHLRYRLTLRV